jgi:hypothetical protein
MAPLFLLAVDRADASMLPLPIELASVPVDRLFDGRAHPGHVMVMMTLMAIREGRRRRARPGLGAAVRAGAARRIAASLLEYQNADGSWNGNAMHTQLVLLGLHAVGLGPADDRFRAALDWLVRRKEVVEGRMTMTGFDATCSPPAASSPPAAPYAPCSACASFTPPYVAPLRPATSPSTRKTCSARCSASLLDGMARHMPVAAMHDLPRRLTRHLLGARLSDVLGIPDGRLPGLADTLLGEPLRRRGAQLALAMAPLFGRTLMEALITRKLAAAPVRGPARSRGAPWDVTD